MSIIKKFFHYLFNDPRHLFSILYTRFITSLSSLFPTKLYVTMLFNSCMNYKLNLAKPETYNEKLQWLKVFYRNPEYTKMVDKVGAKEYAATIIGKDHIIPTLGVYNNANEIDFDALPNQFVLKCTHDSGVIIICKDKNNLDKESAIKRLNKNLKRKYYCWSREWPYKDVVPRIIAEQYKEDESGFELKDYKFFCFDGEPKALFIASDRSNPCEETKFDFFDMEFNHLPFTNGHPNSTKELKKPKGFETMKQLAAKLSKGIPHVRVDFYDIKGHVYFGEMTFFHWSGLVGFEPIEWDYKFGSWLKLPKSNVGDEQVS